MIEQFGLTTELLTPSEAAHQLGVSAQTLANWRSTKRYELPFVRLGRAIRYKAADISHVAETGLRRAR